MVSLDIIKHAKPIFKESSLQEKCLHGQTQNQNESFNAMIWKQIPKSTYVGVTKFELGLYYAVSHFNIGSKTAIKVY